MKMMFFVAGFCFFTSQSNATTNLRMRCGIKHAIENALLFDSQKGLVVYSPDLIRQLCADPVDYRGAECDGPDFGRLPLRMPAYHSGSDDNGVPWIRSGTVSSRSRGDARVWNYRAVPSNNGLNIELIRQPLRGSVIFKLCADYCFVV
jgi:hypothetical protein